MGVRVLCLRHAESENVVAGVAGALPPAELTPKGRAQAAEAAERLRGAGLTRIYASTAVRARQTAAIITHALGVREVVALEELVEFGIGRLEGTADPAVRARTAAHPGGTVALVGHVGSLTAGLSVLCRGLGERVWGAPLPHAVPFPVEWDGRSWRCASWPALRQDR
ncbi:phosphoglycerate mutase family protein [Nonomuraea angiospora]|uniref:Alpha-ribazole phosphatase/probable phosphoglycerate mutase n=1 Tax=Nonomuraea angiospora TaxID=46172 RepID=A0ABR9MBA2_9ACTN|nr:phosphoglycerate mutase family protein [Nonomuraea angiospora]MBE1590199.1 alpha-ribazole phosphatase/probable phosphoglycerate mutase [Nonomuraea angiospora]